MERLLRVMFALLTGPLMVLAVVAAIPVVLVIVALGGVMAVFFCWTLWWGFIWLIGADADAGRYFLQALVYTMAPATGITLLVWAMMSVRDLLFRERRVIPATFPDEPDDDDMELPVPANDSRPRCFA